MKIIIAFLASFCIANVSLAKSYGRSGVDGDQLVLLYIALAALMFIIGFMPEIKKRLTRYVNMLLKRTY